MISAILYILLFVLVLFVVGLWIHALCKWDGTKPCLPEDCDSCPFPPCEDRPINKENERKDPK